MNTKRLTQLALVLLITGAIDNIRNLPTTALFGSSLIFFILFSALIFLIPTALVSAQLASSSQEKGGIYYWTCLALGEKAGLLALWLQWVNTLVWFPTILSFIAGTTTYLFNPGLANNKIYLVSFVIIIFWSMTLVSLKGVHTSAKFANICVLIGTVIPMVLMIGLAVFWVISGKPLEISFTPHTLFPTLTSSENWISLTAIIASFLGIELATVHINEVKDPEKTFPRALFLSVVIIILTMALGSLAIALILPVDKINLVDGTMQAFAKFFSVYHLGAMVPIITLMIVIGSLGNMIIWIISPAKGLLQAAETGYLPSYFTFKNKHGVASRILIAQAIVVTVVCLASQLMPSVNGSYWLLTDLSTQLYVLMYIPMFIAALVLAKKLLPSADAFQIPGGKLGTWLVCLLGLTGCMITLAVGFIPPPNIDVGGARHYITVFTSGMLVMIAPVLFFYGYKKVTTKTIAPK
ncbi:MAG: APC family permease [Chthoniobacterales bacterium]